MQHIKSLIAQYRNIFSENDLDLGCTDLLKQDNNSSKRVFSTISGAGDINFKNPYLKSTNALLNTSRGKTDILIVNTSEKPVYIYRNSKVGTLSTFHVTEINSLKLLYYAWQKQQS